MRYEGDWTSLAACRDKDPELFFPVSDMGPGARQVTEAKAVCAGCPVRSECLTYALEDGLDHGIFGGLTERDRRELTRKREHQPSRGDLAA
jgi:WhiB family redox-sensing transcriptional regulator